MKVLIVLNTLNDSKSVAGGVKHYTLLAHEWNQMGHQADFVAAKAGFPQIREFSPLSRLICSDPFFDATSYLSKTWLYFPAYIYRMLSAHWLPLPDRYDIIYASSQFIVEFYGALVLARRQQTALTLKILHVLNTRREPEGFFNRLFLWAERFTVRWIHQRLRQVLCLSQAVASDYHAVERSLGLSPTPAVVAGCGLDFSQLQPGGALPKIFEAVFVGRMHEAKGVFELPEVWKRVVAARPKARLLVVGEGPHRNRLQEMAKNLGLIDNVTFTGALPEERKNALVSQSKIGLSLSHEEGWGLSVMEFLAVGLPVVAFHLPVFDELCRDKIEMVPQGAANEMSARILSLLENEPRQRLLGEEGRLFAKQYDIKKVAAAELKILEGLRASLSCS